MAELIDSIDARAEGYVRTLVEGSCTLPELADKDRFSPTYGSFFYMCWRAKSVGYANARFQEAAYTLALLYTRVYPGNHFQGMAQIKELARAGMLYWARCQHADGSFDEWYLNEHGFAATAFSSFALSRAFLLLREEFAGEEQKVMLSALRLSARWLERHDDLAKTNHQAVAAAALYSLAEVLNDPSLRASAREKVQGILSVQTAEGWFPELGGLDTGYSFLTLEYLSLCYLSDREDRLKKALERALEFLSFFVHPDISTGREYNLCGNSYVSLLAGAILSEFSPLARGLFREGISRSNILIQLAQDDLSRCYHFYIGILAYDYYRQNRQHFGQEISLLPYQLSPFRKYFRQGNTLAVRTCHYYAIAAFNHGGLLKVFPYPQKADQEPDLGGHDLGYTISFPSGRRLHSARLAQDNIVTFADGGEVEVTASFREGKYFFPSIFSRLLLQLLSVLPYGYLLVKKGTDFIRKKKKSTLQLTAVSGQASSWWLKRRIAFSEEEVSTRDEITAGTDVPGASVRLNLEIRKGGYVINPPWTEEGEKLSLALVTGRRAVLKKIIRPGEAGIRVEFSLRGD